MQDGFVHMRSTRAVSLQALRDDPQEDTQHHVQYRAIALHKVAQALGHRQHPLAHLGLGGAQVALTIELARTGHFKPGLVVLG